MAIFLRDTQHLNEICLLLWLGPALLGIHVTEPYLALLIDNQATHLDLLKILPQLYQELVDCPGKISQISRPAFPSLKDVWIDPLSAQSPYRQEVGKAISDAINRLDKNLLEKYLREMAKEMGVILKQQRGMLYLFSTSSDKLSFHGSYFWIIVHHLACTQNNFTLFTLCAGDTYNIGGDGEPSNHATF